MGATDISILDGVEASGAELRAPLEAMQAGVYDLGDLKVTPRSIGDNRSVDVAKGRAVVATSSLVLPAYIGRKYWVVQDTDINSDSFELGGIAAPHATYSRLDQIIARVYDNDGGLRKWRLEVLTGTTPTMNATLDNRHNAAALPDKSIRLADVVVPTTGIISSGSIRDRRPWARGAYWRHIRDWGNPTTTTTSFALIDSTNFYPRIECSGAPLRVTLAARATLNAAGEIAFAPWIDGAWTMDGGGPSRQTTGGWWEVGAGHASWVLSPSAGSHVVGPAWLVSTGTGTIFADAFNGKMVFTVEEIVRQNANNS